MAFKEKLNNKIGETIRLSSIPPEVHETPDQLGRRARAEKIKADSIKETDSGYSISGSADDDYIVYLGHDNDTCSCTCTDYLSRMLPCKHLYRLLIDRGLIPETVKVDRRAKKEFADNVQSEIDRYYKFYKSGAISVDKFRDICKALTK